MVHAPRNLSETGPLSNQKKKTRNKVAKKKKDRGTAKSERAGPEFPGRPPNKPRDRPKKSKRRRRKERGDRKK